MKQVNLLEGAAEILGLQNSSFPILRRCANLVLSNIAVNYIDFLRTQVFDVENDKIEYKDFELNFLRIKRVIANGTRVEPMLFVDFLKVPNGKVEVEYCFVPQFSEDIEQEILLPNVSEQTLVYGIITEYALISGMNNEAAIWNEKFERGLFGLSEKNKNKKIKALRW